MVFRLGCHFFLPNFELLTNLIFCVFIVHVIIFLNFDMLKW